MKNEIMPVTIYFLVSETENVEFDKLEEVYEHIVEFKLEPGTYCIYKGTRVI